MDTFTPHPDYARCCYLVGTYGPPSIKRIDVHFSEAHNDLADRFNDEIVATRGGSAFVRGGPKVQVDRIIKVYRDALDKLQKEWMWFRHRWPHLRKQSLNVVVVVMLADEANDEAPCSGGAAN